MRLPVVAHQSEWLAELSMQAIRAISHHRQAAALERTVFRESSHDDMAAGPDGMQDLPDVGVTVGRFGKEMEDGPVMPDIVCVAAKPCLADIGFNPLDFNRPFTETALCGMPGASA